MCTVVDDDGDGSLMTQERTLSSVLRSCRSCDKSAVVVLRKRDSYCKNCFLSSATHKFRATIGKSKMLKVGEKVLVVFSGTHSSVTLLHMLYTGINENSNKRLVFSADVLYIDDGIILNKSVQERNKVIEQVKHIAQSLNFKLIITTLSEIFSEIPSFGNNLCINEDNDNQLKQLFENVNSMTSKQDLLAQLKYKLSVSVGQILGYDKMFTDEIGTSLAVKLLVGISLGRGGQLAEEMGFCDSRNENFPVLRPLKEFTAKEIIYYNVFNALDAVIVPTLTTMSSIGISIHKTAENFIDQLQDGFPSTVYTVFRTGDKFKSNIHTECAMSKMCALCKGLITPANEDGYNAMEALKFSKKISELGTSGVKIKVPENVNETNQCSNCSCSKQLKIDEENEAEKILCYSCSSILKEMTDGEILKNLVMASAVKERNIESLRNEISEYLIE